MKFGYIEKYSSIIGSEIELLNINSIDLSISLTYFRNLKSIIISSPNIYAKEQLKQIFESEYFIQLHSFKIQENKIYFNRLLHDYSIDHDDLLEKVFNHKCSLKTFECLKFLIFHTTK